MLHLLRGRTTTLPAREDKPTSVRLVIDENASFFHTNPDTGQPCKLEVVVTTVRGWKARPPEEREGWVIWRCAFLVHAHRLIH